MGRYHVDHGGVLRGRQIAAATIGTRSLHGTVYHQFIFSWLDAGAIRADGVLLAGCRHAEPDDICPARMIKADHSSEPCRCLVDEPAGGASRLGVSGAIGTPSQPTSTQVRHGRYRVGRRRTGALLLLRARSLNTRSRCLPSRRSPPLQRHLPSPRIGLWNTGRRAFFMLAAVACFGLRRSRVVARPSRRRTISTECLALILIVPTDRGYAAPTAPFFRPDMDMTLRRTLRLRWLKHGARKTNQDSLC